MTQLLTIDAGTTSVKVAVFDVSGHMLATSLQEYTLLTPAADWVELPGHIYWQSAVAGIQKVLADAHVGASDIAAVGVTGQGETIIPVDSEGRALRNAIVWLDNRAANEARQVAASFDPDLFYETTGLPEIIPSWPACKLLWIRNHEPDVFARVHKVLLVEDFLLHKLSGEYASEGGVCTSTGYFDIRSGDWWPEMLEFLGVQPEQLPHLVDSGRVVGPLTPEASRQTGLGRNTVAVTGSMDVIAGAIGAGNIVPGIVCENTGTALVLTTTVKGTVYDPGRRLPCYFHALPGSYLLQPYGQTAGMMLRWFRDQFGDGLDYDDLVATAADVRPGSDGLVALPHLTGSTSPDFNPRAKGVFYGITLRHTRAHFVHAILEAVAFMLRENIALLHELGVEPRELISLGGAARSNQWLQLKADVTGLPVRRSQCEEAASLGAAILAAVAVGLYKDIDAACRAMVHVGPQIAPSAECAAAYGEAYSRYQALFQALGPVFDR